MRFKIIDGLVLKFARKGSQSTSSNEEVLYDAYQRWKEVCIVLGIPRGGVSFSFSVDVVYITIL